MPKDTLHVTKKFLWKMKAYFSHNRIWKFKVQTVSILYRVDHKFWTPNIIISLSENFFLGWKFIFKISWFFRWIFRWKSHWGKNPQFVQKYWNLIFDKVRIFKRSFLSKFTILKSHFFLPKFTFSNSQVLQNSHF